MSSNRHKLVVGKKELNSAEISGSLSTAGYDELPQCHKELVDQLLEFVNGGSRKYQREGCIVALAEAHWDLETAAARCLAGDAPVFKSTTKKPKQEGRNVQRRRHDHRKPRWNAPEPSVSQTRKNVKYHLPSGEDEVAVAQVSLNEPKTRRQFAWGLDKQAPKPKPVAVPKRAPTPPPRAPTPEPEPVVEVAEVEVPEPVASPIPSPVVSRSPTPEPVEAEAEAEPEVEEEVVEEEEEAVEEEEAEEAEEPAAVADIPVVRQPQREESPVTMPAQHPAGQVSLPPGMSDVPARHQVQFTRGEQRPMEQQGQGYTPYGFPPQYALGMQAMPGMQYGMMPTGAPGLNMQDMPPHMMPGMQYPMGDYRPMGTAYTGAEGEGQQPSDQFIPSFQQPMQPMFYPQYQYQYQAHNQYQNQYPPQGQQGQYPPQQGQQAQQGQQQGGQRQYSPHQSGQRSYQAYDHSQ
ncbi:hypothetical protein KIPB_001658 [Kipferlia bialata]|uniref:Uncharacterized protein n=1 Tax=Kipferlia bialata TaxID=797122 RepID=A0A391P0E2_9EUKA|nr:hypothetical protein KIPB_001658 [Kipferlia bialata]|eukprot:g1658.t1